MYAETAVCMSVDCGCMSIKLLGACMRRLGACMRILGASIWKRLGAKYAVVGCKVCGCWVHLCGNGWAHVCGSYVHVYGAVGCMPDSRELCPTVGSLPDSR